MENTHLLQIQAQTIAIGFTLFAVGLGCIVLFSFGYEFMTKYDDRVAIEQKNVAAGVNWALNLVAVGLLLSRAVDASNSLWVFLVWFGVGSTLIMLYRLVIDAVVIPEINLDDELSTAVASTQDGAAPLDAKPDAKNWGVAVLAGVMSISLVQCLNTFLRDCEFEMTDPH